MNLRGTLLAIAAAALFAPSALQASPPVVIGDGSVCLAAGSPFPDKGNTHSTRLAIAKIVVDSAPQSAGCAPRPSCKGAGSCTEFSASDPVVVFYSQAGTESDATITANAAGGNLNFALGGGDWSQFADEGASGRQKVSDKDATLTKVVVGGKEVSCTHCRVTFVAK